jgi:antitoxin VapB
MAVKRQQGIEKSDRFMRKRSRDLCITNASELLQRTVKQAIVKKGRSTYRKVDTPVSLNVKDPEAHQLAQAIAQETGETLTRAVTEALRERYQRLQSRRARASVEELRAIAKRAAAHLKGPYLDHAEFLYDERGLPK